MYTQYAIASGQGTGKTATVAGAATWNACKAPMNRSVVLAPTIVPPRLTGRNEEEANRLARDNAGAIEALLQEVRLTHQSILVINDATLYLQAGRYERLMAVIQQAPTALINAYYGHSFPDYQLSRQERRLTDRLIEECDRVIRLP